MREITNRDDITLLVHTFYERVGQDPLLSPAFNEVAGVDWETHLPKMVDFWETVLFKANLYKGNPTQVHSELREKMKARPDHLTLQHFDHWISLFKKTVDDLFEGERAEAAKRHAYQLGRGLTVHLFEMTQWK